MQHKKRVDCWVLGNVAWKISAVHPTIATPNREQKKIDLSLFYDFPKSFMHSRARVSDHVASNSAFDGHQWYRYKNWQ
jgi:hypothetical protein